MTSNVWSLKLKLVVNKTYSYNVLTL